MTAVEVPACVSWYARTRRVSNMATNLINALHSGFWMALLRDETFQQFDSYPHRFWSPHDEPRPVPLGLEAWEVEVLSTHFQDCKSLLLIAGDGGREIISFVKNGIDINAVDFCGNLVETTNQFLAQQGVRDRVTLTERYVLPTFSKTHDAIWIGRQFLSTIHGRRRRIAFFEQLREIAAADTTLLLSFYIRQGNGLDWRLNQWLGRIGRFITRNPGEEVELGDHLDLDAPLYHHHFVEAELRNELRQAGWDLSQYTTDWFGYALATPAPATCRSKAPQTLLQSV